MTKIRSLFNQLMTHLVTYACNNPRNIVKVFAKVVAATLTSASAVMITHGLHFSGGLVAAFAAGLVTLDGYLSDSSSKEKSNEVS